MRIRPNGKLRDEYVHEAGRVVSDGVLLVKGD